MRAPESLSNKFTTQTSILGQVLEGGYYQLAAHSAGWNSAALSVDQLLPDGSTWLASTVLALTADGVAKDYLPPGQYRLTVATGTPSSALSAALVRIPAE